MARNDWVALVTEASREYTAYNELIRFEKHPYLPQVLRMQVVEGTAQWRKYPLFSRYLLLPFSELDKTILRACQGFIRSDRVVLGGENGNLWRAPNRVIQALMDAEKSGILNENYKIGEKVRINDKILSNIEAFVTQSSDKSLTLLTPLLGGARIRTTIAKVVRA